MGEASADGVTHDAFFGGRLVLAQPARGHRSGTDAVLLAAAAPAGFAGLCYDMGAGTGAVGLGIAALRPGASTVLVERDPGIAALARVNAAASGAQTEVAVCDILDRVALRRALPDRAALVVSNPPFFEATLSRPSPDPLRRSAHTLDEGATLATWLLACLDRLDDKGTIVLIHLAVALPAILSALADRVGGIAVKPVLPREGAAAHRVLVRAVKGSRAPFTLVAPLVLHDAGGRLTPEADRLHRGEEAFAW